MFFESSLGELTKLIANGIPKLSTEPSKRTLVTLQAQFRFPVIYAKGNSQIEERSSQLLRNLISCEKKSLIRSSNICFIYLHSKETLSVEEAIQRACTLTIPQMKYWSNSMYSFFYECLILRPRLNQN